jgi:hypothetical protein
MIDGGLLTPEQAAVHPDASLLDRAIGHQPTVRADVSDWMDIDAGDRILLCSDGLCGYVSDEEIAGVMGEADEPQRATDRLIEYALAKGGEDNVTVQLIGYKHGRWLGRFAPPSRGTLWIALTSAALGATVAGGGVAAWLSAKRDQPPDAAQSKAPSELGASTPPAVPPEPQAPNPPPVPAPAPSSAPPADRGPEPSGTGAAPESLPLPQLKPTEPSAASPQPAAKPTSPARQGAKAPPPKSKPPPPASRKRPDTGPVTGSTARSIEVDAGNTRTDASMPAPAAPTVPAAGTAKPSETTQEPMGP